MEESLYALLSLRRSLQNDRISVYKVPRKIPRSVSGDEYGETIMDRMKME
jgi:hypothetical protein